MYAVQTAAYEFRGSHVGIETNSTPTTPPTHKPLDLEAITAQKIHIVNNLPTHCAHCQAEFPPQSIVELKDGCVMAYCKQKGACGKSQVLFAGIELKTPIYGKSCRFQRIQPAPREQDLPEGTEQSSEVVESITAALLAELNRPRVITMEDHNPTCATCGNGYLSHKQDVDQNGWRITGYTKLDPLPTWPRFHQASGTWR